MNTDGYVPWNGIWDVDYHELSYEKAVEIKNQLRDRMQERAEMLLRRS